MKTERVFLMELFLDDELPKNIKTRIKDRFQELEDGSATQGVRINPHPISTMDINAQSPSMQRIMAQNQDLIPRVAPPVTAAAAQALAARNALIRNAANEKPDEGKRNPRKI